MCLTTTVRPSEGNATGWLQVECNHRLSNVPHHAAKLQNMQRSGLRWHGTIDFPMCLTSMVRRSCRTCKSWMPMAWNHRLPDVPDHDSRVAGHATEWMSMRLWSNGYVLYSPSGPVIAVRYEGDKSNSFSDWVTNDKEAEAVQEKLRTLLRVLHSNQSVEKPRNLSGKLGKFEPEPFCSSQLDQYCGPRLVVLGRQWDACL